MHRQRRLAGVAWLLWLALSGSSSALARPVDDVVASGYLSVFVYSDYAPYSWKHGGEYRGIDVDIARAMAADLGVELRLLMRGADENLDDDLRVNVWKGDVVHRQAADVMLHVPYDREVDMRNEFVVLGFPYFQDQMAIVHDRHVLPAVETFGYFVTRPIAVEVDTAGDFFLSNAFNGQLRQSVRHGRTFDEAAAMYTRGEVAALMGSRAQVEWVASIASERDSHVAQPPMPGIVRTAWPVGIAIKHDSRDLGYALGDVLDTLISSGEMAAIAARYGVSYVEPLR